MGKDRLTKKKIDKKIKKRLKKYKKLGFLGQYGMFMGIAQLLEIALKNLLVDKYGGALDTVERWTMGRTSSELERKGLRMDLVILLKNIVEKRNYIAHELLANEMITKSLLAPTKGDKHYSKDMRFLHKSILELEHVMVLFTWAAKKGAW